MWVSFCTQHAFSSTNHSPVGRSKTYVMHLGSLLVLLLLAEAVVPQLYECGYYKPTDFYNTGPAWAKTTASSAPLGGDGLPLLGGCTPSKAQPTDNSWAITYQYDDAARMTAAKRIDTSQQSTMEWYNVFNDKGLIESTTVLTTDGVSPSSTVDTYTYDGTNRLVAMYEYQASSEYRPTTAYNYQNANPTLPVNATVSDVDGLRSVTTVSYTFGSMAMGMPVLKMNATTVNVGNPAEWAANALSYDSAGHLTRVSTTTSWSAPSWTQFKYDSQGRCVQVSAGYNEELVEQVSIAWQPDSWTVASLTYLVYGNTTIVNVLA